MAKSTALVSTSSRDLASSDPVELLQQAEVLRRRAEQSFGEYALEAGRLLLAAKRKTKHGDWSEFLSRYWGGSQRTAEVYARAYKKWQSMSAPEREEAMSQPFTRSLLVLSQATRPSLPSPMVIEQPVRAAEPNGNTQADVQDFMQQRDLDTTRLMQHAVDYDPSEVKEETETPAYTPEPTPFDDIESIVGRPTVEAGETDQDFPPLNAAEQLREAMTEIEERDTEIQRLEQELRRTNQALDSAREAMLTSVAPASPQRGWDYIGNLYQYLKADEPQRTPETLARRAVAIPGGREVIAYLEMFFTAARTQLNQVA